MRLILDHHLPLLVVIGFALSEILLTSLLKAWNVELPPIPQLSLLVAEVGTLFAGIFCLWTFLRDVVDIYVQIPRIRRIFGLNQSRPSPKNRRRRPPSAPPSGGP